VGTVDHVDSQFGERERRPLVGRVESFPAYVETRALVRSLGERLSRADAPSDRALLRLHLGIVHAACGEHETALRHLSAARRAAVDLGDSYAEAHAVLGIGRVCVARDEDAQAQRALDRLAWLAPRVDDASLEAENPSLAGDLSWARGSRADA
jgi:tetratricopeptide (TPR) repeat protein